VPDSPKIVAIGLLTQHELELLGQGFDRAFPISDELVFEDLLRAIDEAELAHAAGTGPRSTRPFGG
jgi:hypothetical protein